MRAGEIGSILEEGEGGSLDLGRARFDPFERCTYRWFIFLTDDQEEQERLRCGDRWDAARSVKCIIAIKKQSCRAQAAAAATSGPRRI